jgi:hypothetical protein
MSTYTGFALHCRRIVAAVTLAGAPSLGLAQTQTAGSSLPLPTRTTLGTLTSQDSTSALLRPQGLRPIRIEHARARPPAVGELAHAAAQEVTGWSRSIDYSGPRFGFTYLPKSAVDSLKAHKIDVGTTITQFGWQLEREIHVSPEGPRILNEWVFLAGGLESGVFLPSLTWLVGARDRTGNEIGVGPNASVAGVGLAAAAGVTVHDGGVNFPMNIAVAKSKGGMRVSFLTGFTIH